MDFGDAEIGLKKHDLMALVKKTMEPQT